MNDKTEQINKAFTYHAPKGNQADLYVELRAKAKALAEDYVRVCPPGREQSLAITKLEEASMWANAAIARNPPKGSGAD